jgi:hypothetical protein
MKTGGDLGIPSKICLLKDLVGAYWEGGVLFLKENAPPGGILEIVKEQQEPPLLSNS